MWEQLKYYTDIHNNPKSLGTMPEKTGTLIQILKSIKYFKQQEQIYGADILQCYVSMLQCYNLSDGMQLLDFNGVFYVVVDGVLRCSKKHRNSHQQQYDLYETQGKIDIISDGMALSSSNNIYDTIKAQGHTKLLKVYRYHSKYTKLNHRLTFMEKQRYKKSKQMEKIINNNILFQQIKQKLKKIQLFKHLEQYDINQVVIESKINRYPKSTITHQIGQQVKKIGVIINGNIKIIYATNQGGNNSNDGGRAILKKYLIHKHRLDALQDTSITANLVADDCIGLQEFLWNQNYVSKSQVISVQVQIVQIPVQIFGKKFNEITNFTIYTKIKGLIESKKFLTDKTLKAKQQKEQQFKMKLYQQKKMKELQKNQSKTKRQKLSRKNHYTLNISDIVPEQITHKIFSENQDRHSSLPKKNQRVNLFPQLFQNASIPIQFRQKLKFAKQMYQNRNRISKRKPAHFPHPNISPEKIHQKTLADNLQKIDQQQKQKQFGKKYRKQRKQQYKNISSYNTITTDNSYKNFSSLNASKSRLPQLANNKQSICNNFTLSKGKSSSRYQTLEIV